MRMRDYIRDFLARYQTLGWIAVLAISAFLLQLTAYVGLSAAGRPEAYKAMAEKLALPYHLKDLIFQPWSLVTFPFFPATFDVLYLLMGGMLFWQFGRIHQQLIGEFRTRRLIILATPIIGLLTVTASTFVSFRELPEGAMPFGRQPGTPVQQQQAPTPVVVEGEKGNTAIYGEGEITSTTQSPTSNLGPRVDRTFLFASGLIFLGVLLMMGCIAVVPDFPVQLFPFGSLKIKWVGVIVMLILLFWTALSPSAFAILISGTLGMLHVVLLKRGTDLTDLVWSYYTDKSPKPKMKVKHGGRKEEEQFDGVYPGPKPTADTVSQEMVDQILDKINEKGYNSLTREEKELLYRASQDQDGK